MTMTTRLAIILFAALLSVVLWSVLLADYDPVAGFVASVVGAMVGDYLVHQNFPWQA